jgi:predicted HAD superfamily phosphohydrolase YqeG
MLLKPSWHVKDVTHLPLEALQAKGIKGFLFDLDDTLMAHKTGVVPPHVQRWLATIGASLI